MTDSWVFNPFRRPPIAVRNGIIRLSGTIYHSLAFLSSDGVKKGKKQKQNNKSPAFHEKLGKRESVSSIRLDHLEGLIVALAICEPFAVGIYLEFDAVALIEGRIVDRGKGLGKKELCHGPAGGETILTDR